MALQKKHRTRVDNTKISSYLYEAIYSTKDTIIHYPFHDLSL